MDIKEKITEIVEKVKNDPSFMKKFEEEPVKAIEQVAGVDLPDDVVEKIIDGVKANLTMDNVSKVTDAFKKLF